MDKQTIYILMAMAAFCIIFFLYLLTNHSQKDVNSNEDLKYDVSFKKKFDLIYENYKQKNYISKRLSFAGQKSEGNPLVWMNAFPKYTEPNSNGNFNFTITWKSTNASTAEYSWIGIYPYAPKTDIFNCLSYFYLHKRLVGADTLPIPSQAGYFDFRYIQDNNKKTLATHGPVLVNPKDSYIAIVDEEDNNFNNFNFNEYNPENNFNNVNNNNNIKGDAFSQEENLRENLVDLKHLKNYAEEKTLKIQWNIGGKSLENLLNKIFDENRKKQEAEKKAKQSAAAKPNADFNPKSKSGGNEELKAPETLGEKKPKSNGNQRILAQITSTEKANNKLKSPKQFSLDSASSEEEKIKNNNKEKSDSNTNCEINMNNNGYKDLNEIELILKTQKINVFICLTLLGSINSAECLWKKQLETLNHLNGSELIKTPKLAGYYYLRIFLEKDFNFYESTDQNIVVSKLFKISSPKAILLPESLESVVGSYLGLSWFSAEPQSGDWIGLYNLGDTDAFLESMTPIKAIRLNKDNAFFGNSTAFLPNNKEAGQYVFVYFRNHKPYSISDVMEVQQPKVSCPNTLFYSRDSNKQILESLFGPSLNYANYANENSNNTNSTLKTKPISAFERLKMLETLPQFTQSKIKHLVIICTENHSFDSYMGEYCESEAFSDPKCNYGSKCCEKPPKTLNGQNPFILNDTQNIKFDPNHNQYCELCEINNGKMDGYIKGCSCSDPQNFAVADRNTVQILHEYARNYSLADQFFQPNAGASAQNDMYFARAAHVFLDNRKISMGSFGSNCWYTVHFLLGEYQVYYDPTITHLLSHCNFTLRAYAEGYDIAKKNFTGNPCYPLGYDSSDIPFNYYAGVLDKPNHIQDFINFSEDIKNKTLPEVSFIKPLGVRTAHPGYGNITDEMNFFKETVDLVLNDEYYKENTLILYVPDESGGYYDHISPPPTNEVDDVPYGPRIPVVAIGKFAKKNYVSHVTMEHSSIIRFIEWNWLNGETGQLNVRDKNVNSIGDLIDPEQAGVIVP